MTPQETQRLAQSAQQSMSSMEALRKAVTDALVEMIVKVKSESGIEIPPDKAMSVLNALNKRFGPKHNLSDPNVQTFIRELLR